MMILPPNKRLIRLRYGPFSGFIKDVDEDILRGRYVTLLIPPESPSYLKSASDEQLFKGMNTVTYMHTGEVELSGLQIWEFAW